MKKLATAVFLGWLFLLSQSAHSQWNWGSNSAVNSTGTFTVPLLGATTADCSAPTYSFSGDTNTGITNVSADKVTICGNGAAIGNWAATQVDFFPAGTGRSYLNNTAGLNLGSGVIIGWSSNTDAGAGAADAILLRDGANNVAMRNSTTSQAFSLYNTYTNASNYERVTQFWSSNDFYLGLGVAGTGVATRAGNTVFDTFNIRNQAQTVLFQIRPNVATCTSNCGTSPSVAGSNSAGTVTMGASGVPASGWVLTFSSAWTNAPTCLVQSALTTMVVGKMPIAVQTSTTTITVTTNGTAPATSDQYHYHCFGR